MVGEVKSICRARKHVTFQHSVNTHVTNLKLAIECGLLFLRNSQRLLQLFFISLGKTQLLT